MDFGTMYKIYKIRVKGTETYYKVLDRNWSASQQEYVGKLRTDTFQRSKTYSRKGTAKSMLNRIIKCQAGILGSLGDTLFDLPVVELVEFNVMENA